MNKESEKAPPSCHWWNTPASYSSLFCDRFKCFHFSIKMHHILRPDRNHRQGTFRSKSAKSSACVDRSRLAICGCSGGMRDEPIKLMSVCAIPLNVAERCNSQRVHGCEVKRTQGTISWCVFFTTSYSVNSVTCYIRRDVTENHLGRSSTFKSNHSGLTRRQTLWVSGNMFVLIYETD